MKKLSLILLLALASHVIAGQTIKARVTAYYDQDHWSRSKVSATGLMLRDGVCAVDPKVIPYGTHLKINGEIYIAADTGRAVKNRTAAVKDGKTVEEKQALVIDLYKPNGQQWPDYIQVEILD